VSLQGYFVERLVTVAITVAFSAGLVIGLSAALILVWWL
jgi:hypothetical protein